MNYVSSKKKQTFFLKKVLTKNKCLLYNKAISKKCLVTVEGINMKIVNTKKFIRMVTLIAVVILAVSFYFSNISFSKEERKTKIISISNGDTLWTIAKQEQKNNKYYQNKHIRDVIYEIRKLNNLENNTNLLIGQKLMINYL